MQSYIMTHSMLTKQRTFDSPGLPSTRGRGGGGGMGGGGGGGVNFIVRGTSPRVEEERGVGGVERGGGLDEEGKVEKERRDLDSVQKEVKL